MKFIHTADWHLGRQLSGVSLLEDQRHVLNQFLALVESEKPDAVVVAGDLYDRSVPPSDAVALLDEVLRQLVLELGTPTILIGGNHDGPQRLSFGASFLEKAGLHLRTGLERVDDPITLEDAHGTVDFYAVPYAEPAEVRNAFPEAEAHTHEAAMGFLVGRIAMARKQRGNRSVLIGHAFVAGGEESESERPLSVGGAGTIPASLFSSFNYTALGHLHRTQTMGEKKTVRYTGSPLKYSFSAVSH